MVTMLGRTSGVNEKVRYVWPQADAPISKGLLGLRACILPNGDPAIDVRLK